jgi:predicted enzyme related to lactoylglutathione lyase
MTTHLLGLRTVIYPAPHLDVAKDWYRRALGIEPYFDQPFYVGFNVGSYELGLDPNAPPAPADSGGPLAYWGVNAIDSALEHLLTVGASLHSAAQDVGDGIQVASVRDPIGNLLGLIENPHFQIPSFTP